MMIDYQAPADLLAKRVILVTGAAMGIGASAAKAYAACGASVVLLDKKVPELEAVYDAIVETGGNEPAIYPMDLVGAAPRDFDDLAAKLEETFGCLDGLLHSAASLPYLSRLKDYESSDWMKVMQVNLNAPFLITQACLPLLLQATDASVILSSDAVGRRARAYWGAYAVSKFGIEGLMQTLAEELENTQVRVNSVDPGPTRTALRRRVFPGEDPAALKPPEALMPLYLWLIGPDSKGTTGQALTA